MSLVILAGPSAIGKSFMARLLMTHYPDSFTRVPVYTTRPKRDSEAQIADRIFLSAETFEDMVRQRLFYVHETFAGHMYGYHRKYFAADRKHLLIDLPPYFLPAFLGHDKIITIGLHVSDQAIDWLEGRMKARGDPPHVRAARRQYIERDINDLRSMRPLIERHGKLFLVEDDDTIPSQVVPWLAARLGLSGS